MLDKSADREKNHSA